MKDASDAILECKSWKSKLEDANAPSQVVSALVAACNEFLAPLENLRLELETCVANGGKDEDVLLRSQNLVLKIADYRIAARHCKKHTAKPKPKAGAKAQAK